MNLPNLLIIGAMKCGTTSLHNYLDMHPEIHMSNPKEIEFFSNDQQYQKGMSWYSTHFEKGYKYNGESSTNYTKRHTFPNVSARIKQHLGSDVKLIYVVKDPIDRIQSNFTDSKTYLHIPSSCSINEFTETKQEDNPFLKTSMYYYQIEAYLSLFDLKNMYFLKAEDLRKNPQATMDLLFGFLGLEPILVKHSTTNQSASKTYYSTRYLKLVNSPWARHLLRMVPTGLLTAIKGSKLLKRVSKRTIDPTLDHLNAQNRALLKRYLEEDHKKFGELTNIHFW